MILKELPAGGFFYEYLMVFCNLGTKFKNKKS